MKKKIIGSALLVIAVLGALVISIMFKDTSQYNVSLREESIIVSINPEVLFNTDNKGYVKEILHINEDAKIYKEEDFLGLEIKEAVDKTIEIAKEHGYVKEDTVVNVSSLSENSVYIEDIVLNLKGNKINVKTKKISKDAIETIVSNIDTTGNVETEFIVLDDGYVIIRKHSTIEGPGPSDNKLNSQTETNNSNSNNQEDEQKKEEHNQNTTTNNNTTNNNQNNTNNSSNNNQNTTTNNNTTNNNQNNTNNSSNNNQNTNESTNTIPSEEDAHKGFINLNDNVQYYKGTSCGGYQAIKASCFNKTYRELMAEFPNNYSAELDAPETLERLNLDEVPHSKYLLVEYFPGCKTIVSSSVQNTINNTPGFYGEFRDNGFMKPNWIYFTDSKYNKFKGETNNFEKYGIYDITICGGSGDREINYYTLDETACEKYNLSCDRW